MKDIIKLLICIFLLPAFNIFGQGSIKTLTTSSLSHTFTNNGFLKYYDDGLGNYYEDYYNPTNNAEGYTLGSFAGLILTGDNSNGYPVTSLHSESEKPFYIPGILIGNGQPFADNVDYFDRIWSTSSEEVRKIQELFKDGDLTLEDIPKDILEWPSKGNSYFGYLITEELAPFHDNDADNIYNPMNGDYPIVYDENPEFIPSKYTFCVYHNNVLQNLSSGDHNSIQISQINYTLDCQDGDLKNSVFTRLVLEHKGIDDLYDFKLGIFKDYDLGCYENDNFGSHEPTNSIFGYNKDGKDVLSCPGGAISIPENTSCINSTIFLSHPLYASMPTYYFNNSVPNPEILDHYKNLLNGKFPDGTPLTIGGDGYDPTSNDETRFVFSDLPNDPNGWHMNNQENSALFGAAISASIDLGDFYVGFKKTVEFVDVLFPYDKADLSIFDDYENRVSNVEDQWSSALNLQTDCFEFESCDKQCVWPGDVNNNGRVEADDLVILSSMRNDVVSDPQRRNRISSEWQAFSSDGWVEEEAGIDYKFGDVNGNGEVNIWDAELLKDNFKLQNDSYVKQPDIIPNLDPMGIGIEFKNKEEISTTGSILDGVARAEITLGDEDFNISESIVALSFDILIDTNLVFFSPWFNMIGYAFERIESYYEYEDSSDPHFVDVLNYSERRSFGMYQLNSQIDEGGNLINDISISAHDLGQTSNPDGKEYTKIEITNIFALDVDGNQIDLGVRYVDSILVTDLVYNPDLSIENDIEPSASIYPNPVSNMLTIKLKNTDHGMVKVRNLNGRLIKTHEYDSSHFDLNTEDWKPGIYILELTGKNGIVTKKVVKI